MRRKVYCAVAKDPNPSEKLHPDETAVRARLVLALERGTREHYADATQYDHEYRRRRDDVAFYLRVAEKHARRRPILELGCGSGRLTLPLLRAGHDVVGVDSAPAMLAELRAKLGKRAPQAKLIRADFRSLFGRATGDRAALKQRFSLVICPFNAFQHLYDRGDVERFLAGVRTLLAPSGRFVFDVMNPDLRWLSRDPTKRWARTRFKDPRTGEPMIYSTQLVYDAPLQIAFMTIHYEPVSGSRRRGRSTHLTHRHFFPRELEALLHYNGFRIERRDGDFDGGALEAGSEQQVLWCRART
jgi:SAM-dependent methyltransferase